MKKTVAVIPIKLCNTRLPGKNIKILGDKALCKYLFDTVQCVDVIDEIYVYCSDESLKDYMPEGIRFLKRSKELDSDSIKSKDILESFINEVDADIYALLHVTQPFITAETIKSSILKVREEDYDSAFAAFPIREFAWYDGSPINYCLTDVIRTQELKPVYVEGELYVFEKNVFTEKGRRIGDKPWIQEIEWKENICIDDIHDFEMAEAVIALERKNERCK